MTASSRGSRAAASLIRSSRNTRICKDCINSSSRNVHNLLFSSSSPRRSYAVAATALESDSPAPDSHLPHLDRIPPVTATATAAEYLTKSGVVLSRPPLITRPLTSFEKAFFFYQKRLNERLSLPFTRYFYFKKDTPGDADWKLKARERNGIAARELGSYNAYGVEGWNDEILKREKDMVEPKWITEQLVKDARVRAVEGKDGAAVEVEADAEIDVEDKIILENRRTDADRKADMQRLDRKLERTLYLVVKRTDGGWGFPAGGLVGRESLHQAAERVLVQTAGLNMNTWLVGRVPAGHHISKPQYNKDDQSLLKAGEKTFFLKARIMAGQANLKENHFGFEDFRWLTKEEVGKAVGLKYWSSIRNMLADR